MYLTRGTIESIQRRPCGLPLVSCWGKTAYAGHGVVVQYHVLHVISMDTQQSMDT